MAEQVSSSTFQDQVLAAEQPVLVDFFATWCGPCKMMSPVIEEVAEDMAGTAKVYKLDIDQSPDIAHRFGIVSVPTFMVFKGGEVYKKTVGAQAKENILALFE